MTAARLRVGVWSPLPPSPSGVADYVVEAIPGILAHCVVHLVAWDIARVAPGLRDGIDVRSGSEAPEADIDLYHLGYSPVQAFSYRRALRFP
jgi:hypothetical protein